MFGNSSSCGIPAIQAAKALMKNAPLLLRQSLEASLSSDDSQITLGNNDEESWSGSARGKPMLAASLFLKLIHLIFPVT